MASLQVINVSASGRSSSRTFNLTPTRIRTPAEILEEQGRDMKHEIKLLKRRLRYRSQANDAAFPHIAHQFLIEAQGPLVAVNEDGDFSSPGLTDWYVKAYCSINHLKEC